MNVADAQRLASALEGLGLAAAAKARQADVIVLNTCVVRQSAEDKAYNYLNALRPLKAARPELVIGVMGCLVGIRPDGHLKERLPWVDVFLVPSDPSPLLALLRERLGPAARPEERVCGGGDALSLPTRERGQLVCAYIPIVLGCSHACSYCVIPFRRGVERSRSQPEIVAEARTLAAQGVKEVTLLGQIVDRYGYDSQAHNAPSARSPLADLLEELNQVEGLERIRFLTSHPNWMSDSLLETVVRLPKVCEHIELPVQAGDDEVLARMKRGYSADDYRRLVEKIRRAIPGVGIATDIIVGFPGESEAQFQSTYNLMAELKPDMTHIARYSPRPQTLSARTMADDVPAEEKERRRKALDELQAQIVGEINQVYVGQVVEVLVEEHQKQRWRGRTRSNKLVFFEDEADWRGRLARVIVTWAGPWSMIGHVTKP